MIKSIKLKFGRTADATAESVEALPVTVFVGPNNSGKSIVLKEMQSFCQTGNRNQKSVIIDDVEFRPIEAEKIQEKIAGVRLEPGPNDTVEPDHILVGKWNSRKKIHIDALVEVLTHPNKQPQNFCKWYLTHKTLILDGGSRIKLVGPQSAGDLKQSPSTSFQALFKDDEKRRGVRRIIQDAFGLYLVIDPTHLGNFSLRLSKRAPEDVIEEKGIHPEAVAFHSEAMPIEQTSDGVKAFVGMITEMIAGDPMVLLIDEPEAFLHPSLSFKLGKEVSNIMSSSEKRLFVSTHSPDFVMGCIQSGAPVNIVRLTFRDGIPTARILPNGDILRLMRNPLLRSTGVLSGLFYESVVVTESDADRAFYQEINDRMLRFDGAEGIPNCLFLNAQNKQTVKTIIKPLRELGIPVAGVVDIDVIKDGGSVWTSFLDCGFIPEIEKNPLAGLRSGLMKKFNDSGRDMKKEGGKNVLTGSDREGLENLFEKLCEYGLFVVPGGELESWLEHLGASGHGPNWLIEVFEKMGEDPTSEGYVLPGEGDVWEFLSQIRLWFANQRRKGMPQ